MIGRLLGGMLRGTAELGVGTGNVLSAIGKKAALGKNLRSAMAGPTKRAVKEASYQETKKKALSFLNRRVAPAALAYGGGQLAGAYIETRAEERRAYYGNRAYEKRYGTSADTAASLVRGAGSIIGVSALLGMTPSIRRGIAEFGPRRALKAQMRAASKEMDQELRSVARHRGESQFFRRTKIPTESNLSFQDLSRGRPPGQNPMDYLVKDLTKAEQANINLRLRTIGSKEAEKEVARIYNRKLLPQQQHAARARYAQEEKLVRKVEKKEYRELKRRQKQTQKNMEAEVAKPSSSRRDPLAPFTPIKPKGLGQSDITPGYTEATRKLSASKKALEAMGPSQFGFIGKAIKYGSTVSLVGATAEPVLNDPVASFLTGVGVVAGTAAIMKPVSAMKFVRKAAIPVGATAATIATGAAIGSNIPAPAAAEGNIEEAVYNRTSPVRKLNYSTAGLVQSIHNNRRMR